MVLLDEYLELCHSAKIELLSDRLIVGESDNHTQHLFQQILRGWGLEAAIAPQPTLKMKNPAASGRGIRIRKQEISKRFTLS
jgi:hypothetical protein